MEFDKPPLGVMPKSIWMGKRALDLTNGIQRALECNNPNIENCCLWAKELKTILEELR